MAEIRRQDTASIATLTPCPAHVITGLLAGEDLPKGAFVYITHASGVPKVMLADGSAADAEAKAIGVAAEWTASGEACTIHRGVRYRWCKKTADGGPNPGTYLYLSGTNEGELADAASTGGTLPIAFVVDDQGRIQLVGMCG